MKLNTPPPPPKEMLDIIKFNLISGSNHLKLRILSKY